MICHLIHHHQLVTLFAYHVNVDSFIAGVSTIQYEKNSPKHYYMEKEHEFFATMLKAKLKRYDPLPSLNQSLHEKNVQTMNRN